MPSHHLQQINRTNEVILVVFERFALRLTHMLESSKMDHSLERTILRKHLVKTRFVKKRTLHLNLKHSNHLHKLELTFCWHCHFLDCFKTA